MEKVQGIGFTYESANKRDAVRVDTLHHRLVFHKDSHENYTCSDLSFSGASLVGTSKYQIGTSVKFILTYKGRKVGSLIASITQLKGNSSSWKFVKMQPQVKDFIENLVLEVQKSELKQASEKRKVEEEAKLLGLRKKPKN
ncbi:hypothetical protein CBF23_007660 [Marinomonas agarivorans]|nr:hypothetical protein CBF23_007660 [Marinomonas agarivorans]